ncbi:MAG: ATP-binding cassette domain-containing protein [Pseudomonadota bacterium]
MLELENVAYSYGGDDLLTDVNLRLAPGSFHFLTGPSGAGKSTILKLCYMELQPSRGSIRVFDHDIHALTRDEIALSRRRIGVVHQDCQFLDHLTVEENIVLPLVVARRSVEAQSGNLEDLLNWVGLNHVRQSRPPQLSGGERQRMALARAVIMAPDLILADEPTGNVDWEMSERLLTLLIELNKMGKSVILATHDLNLIRNAKSRVSARVLRIANKELQFAGAELS